MRSVKIWDIATRSFHWLLVAAVFVCFLTGEDEGLEFFIHAYAGFLVSMLLVFRAGWGVFGSRHSRFSDFAYSWSEIKSYGLSLLRLKPDHHTGHNPIGGLMIFAMLTVLAGTSATGVLMVAAKAAWLDDVHEALGTAMQILVGLHICGVIVEQIVTGDKLVQAMVFGSKNLPADKAILEPPLVPAWRSIVFAIVVFLAAISAHEKIDFGSAISAFSTEEQD